MNRLSRWREENDAWPEWLKQTLICSWRGHAWESNQWYDKQCKRCFSLPE